MMLRRRTPLMRAPMVGGAGYMAGTWVHAGDLIAVGRIGAEEGALQ
jgi:hypothetical protein